MVGWKEGLIDCLIMWHTPTQPQNSMRYSTCRWSICKGLSLPSDEVPQVYSDVLELEMEVS